VDYRRSRRIVPAMGCLVFGLSTAVLPGFAGTVDANFEGLPDGAVPDGYATVLWGGKWSVTSNPSYPYTPHSPPNVAFTPVATNTEVDFSFISPVYLSGAFFAIAPSNSVYFKLYALGLLVHTSATLVPCTDALPGDPVCDNAAPGTNPSRFLPSGYTNQTIDTVGVFSQAQGFYAMDDVLFNTGAAAPGQAPEPPTGMLAAAGLLMVLAIAIARRGLTK
jgi:hypothetical protein